MIRINNLTHRYTVWQSETKKAKKTVLDGVSLDIPTGQFWAILGPNGCGKSTLAKHLNVLLLPDEGTVWIDGKNSADMARLWEIRRQVGMVFQNPDNQIIGSSVEEDAAFSPENYAVPSPQIQSRVTQSLQAVGLWEKRKTAPSRLSGGQKQRTAIAGTLAAEASCLVLDEPTAMLDPRARREVLQLIRHLNKEKGITVVLITHHTDEVVDADVILLMEKGKVLAKGTPLEIFSDLPLLERVKMDTPQVTALAQKLRERGMPLATPILHTEQLADQLKPLLAGKSAGPEAPKEERIVPEQPVLELRQVRYTYSQKTAHQTAVLDGVSLQVPKGRWIGLVGVSGSGKTTLIKHLNGLLRPDSGDVLFEGQSILGKKYSLAELRRQVGLVFQYPEHQLFGQTVLKDVCFGPLNLGMTREEAERLAKESLELVDIGEEYYYVSPLELSGGQKRRVAIAGVLAMQPRVLVLDEPAAGLDPETKHMIFALLQKIKQQRELSIVLVSHHMEDVAEYADWVYVLHQGKVELSGTPREIFGRIQRLREMGIGVPQVTEFAEKLTRRGVALPSLPTTVEDAAKMLWTLWQGGEADA